MENQLQSASKRGNGIKRLFTRRNFQLLSIFVLFAFLNLTVGCRYYYRVNTKHPYSLHFAQGIDNLRAQNKFFIVHFGDDVFWLKNLTLTNDMTELSGKLDVLPDNRYSYQRTIRHKPNRYLKKDVSVLHEVHIYAHEYAKSDDLSVIIPLESIERIDIYDPHTGATVASWALGVMGAIAASIIILYLIAVLLIMMYFIIASCPFIYVYDGENYVFTGEIFSGAIQPGLERHDYLLLPLLKPENDEYFVMVSNELQEIQHINLMQLQIIDHPADIAVLADKYGQFHSIADPVAPIQAQTVLGNDILAALTEKDSLFYYFDAAANTTASMDAIVLSFEKPDEAEEAKLIISARNTMWLEYVLANFHGMFGSRFNSFDRRQGRERPEDIREMMLNQGFPMNVYLEKNGEWVLQDFYEVAGPMAFKDDILEISLEGIESETVNVKLETGLMFWEIDYVAMDFTGNIPLEITTVPASEAIDEEGNDVSEAIRYDDNLYYVQPEIGNAAILSFPVPELTNESRTIILHSKGYYKVIREYTGIADRKTLRTFREPGRMPMFSKELYEDLKELIQQP